MAHGACAGRGPFSAPPAVTLDPCRTSKRGPFLPRGFLLTIAIEIPILLAGLSRRHPLGDRLIAGIWLTACTYPIVVLVLPALMLSDGSWGTYLWVAETFAPLAECGLFWLAYVREASAGRPGNMPRRAPRSWRRTWLPSALAFGLLALRLAPASRSKRIDGLMDSSAYSPSGWRPNRLQVADFFRSFPAPACSEQFS